MGARICRTAEEAFRAGWDAPCEHGESDPDECRHCELTDTEVAKLLVLLSGLIAPAHQERAAA